MSNDIALNISDERDPRKGIQSVEIGIRVLAALTAVDRPLPLKDIARISGLVSSAAHRYLVSLVRTGIAVQLSDGRYDLGGFALQLGFAAQSRLDAMTVAERHLHQFVQDSGNTAMLTVWSQQGPMVMRWMQGLRPVYTTISLGSRMPLTDSATGAIFLAYGDQMQVKAHLRSTSKAARKALDEKADLVRSAGLAHADGDWVPGLFAQAVPIFNGIGDLFGAFTAISARTPIADETIVLLRDSAFRASGDLGYREMDVPT